MTNVEAVSAMLKPLDARLMRCYPISTRINHVANDDEACSAHTISIRQAGYHAWERTISTSGGKVNLAATLATTDATNTTAQPAIYDSESWGDAGRAARAKHTAQTVHTAAPQN
jgi:hypothetical protein